MKGFSGNAFLSKVKTFSFAFPHRQLLSPASLRNAVLKRSGFLEVPSQSVAVSAVGFLYSYGRVQDRHWQTGVSSVSSSWSGGWSACPLGRGWGSWACSACGCWEKPQLPMRSLLRRWNKALCCMWYEEKKKNQQWAWLEIQSRI